MTPDARRASLDLLGRMNHDDLAAHPGDSSLAARLLSYELAARMQASIPDVVSFSSESAATRALYGLDEEPTAGFGRNCLLARRLLERGVRFVQLFINAQIWDTHTNLAGELKTACDRTDKPIAALLRDLKQRGMLDSTLVVWGGEFGRQPTAEYATGTGRDHNAYGFTMWLAGGGIKGGTSVGTTDELGSAAVERPFHVKHLHATILTQLGLDPERLTYFYNGLDQKLVGVEGAEPIREIME